MDDDPKAIERMILHYRRLREWITDQRTRTALREHEDADQGGEDDERR